jgi:hypothetical protein
MKHDPALNRLLRNKVKLKRLEPDAEEAGLWICSLPLPRKAAANLELNGRPTLRLPIGQWPGISTPSPRRLLLVADGGNAAPAELRLKPSAKAPKGPPPAAALERFACSPEPSFFWERHMVRIAHKGVSICLAMGLRTGGEIRWWEACNMVVRQETPTCRIVEAGGTIPVALTVADDLRKHPGYTFPLLHQHNWLNGHIYARLHANGVCEIYAHHINSKFFDDGLDLKDVVPVIGLRVDGADAGEIKRLCGPWDGSRKEMAIGPVRFDVRDAARLATPSRPGSIGTADGFVVWQPYQAAELFGGLCPKKVTGDPVIVHPEEKLFPRGMARTIRFSLSLSADRSPRVVRYLAPAWWYGLCEEFSPAPLLPVSNEYDVSLAASRDYLHQTTQAGGFEDGCMSRHTYPEGGRGEPSWEGEVPYTQFLYAWRKGGFDDYDLAMRAAWFISDVIVDHAALALRMHGYGNHAFALPMQRIHATVAAFLETGDPYLWNTACAVLDNAYWVHKNSWPRMAVGRDACFIRGAVFLYRYFGDEHYRRMARDAAGDVVAVQRENGTFGDQGGGAGIHAWAAYITKPWMACMALGGLIDYLEVVGDDEVLLGAVKKFADWLLASRFDHHGVQGWSYQHDYNRTRKFFDFYSAKWTDLPSESLWHSDYFARLLPFCSLRFKDPVYFDAWAESYRAAPRKRNTDHESAQTQQYLTWLQDRLWNVRPGGNGFVAAPAWWGEKTPKTGRVETPGGVCTLTRDTRGSLTSKPAGRVRLPRK